MKYLIVSVWMCCSVLSGWAQSVAQKLDRYVQSAALLERSEAGIVVFDLTDGTPVYRYQDKKLYRPASVEKIVTAVTALSVLGEDYRFETRMGYVGEITPDSVLKGDLYVCGGFDPEFMPDDLERLARSVRSMGINRISGKLIGDVSLMDSVYWGAGWSWDDTPESFQPYLSPLMLNRGCVDITVRPSEPGMPPSVTVFPESDSYTVENAARSHAPECGTVRITRDWLHHSNLIQISGNVTRTQKRTLNVCDPACFFLRSFRNVLYKQDIHVEGVAQGIIPDTAVVWMDTVVRPLDPVLKRALKKSDNLSAEALFYHLGIHEKGMPYSGVEESREVICRFMKEKIGRIPENYRIADGSGVSLYNYISPDLLVEYLKYAYYHSAVFQPFYEALPIAGIDGTLQHRMKGGKAYRNVRAKTGTVTGVSSLAGYVRSRNGHMLAFAIINQNVLKGKEARNFQDKICEILAN